MRVGRKMGAGRDRKVMEREAKGEAKEQAKEGEM